MNILSCFQIAKVSAILATGAGVTVLKVTSVPEFKREWRHPSTPWTVGIVSVGNDPMRTKLANSG
jgi:hypothetical protein